MNRYGRFLQIETLEARLPFDVEMVSGNFPDDVYVENCMWVSEMPWWSIDGFVPWWRPDPNDTDFPFEWPGFDAAGQNVLVPNSSQAFVTILARATNNEGSELHEVTVGQEFWIELSARGNRVHEQGVFDARFKVELNPSSLELLPQVEPMSGYFNGMRGVRTPTGFSEIGGFSSSLEPLGSEARPVVRFKVRAIEPGRALIDVSDAALELSPFLLYGVNFSIDPKNVSPTTLVLNINVPPSVETLDHADDSTTTSSVSAREDAFVYAPHLVDTVISHAFGNESRADWSAMVNRERPQQIRCPVVLPAESLDEVIAVLALPLSDGGIEPKSSREFSVGLRSETEQSALKGLTVERI